MKRREIERAGGCEYTLEEIAEILGITRERVRQIEAQTLKKLRRPAVAASSKSTHRTSPTNRQSIPWRSVPL